MKSILAIFMLAVSFFFVTPHAFAQQTEETTPDVSVGFKTGWFLFQENPYNELLDTGNNWTVAIEVIGWVSDDFGIGGEVEYYRKNDDLDYDAFSQNFEITQIPVNMNVYYRFSQFATNMRPFIGGGPSYIYVSSEMRMFADGEEINITNNGFIPNPQEDWVLGFNIVGGIDMGKLVIEAQYLWGKSDFGLSEKLPGTLERNIGGLSIWFGFRF